MPGSYRDCSRQLSIAAIAACTIAVTFPATANAQNLLESLFNALGARPANATAPITSDRTDPGAWDFIDRPAASAGTKTSYCVRLCDGRYFPLPRRAGAVSMSNPQICQAMCPAAETRVFNGTAIERAVADDGKSYSAIKTAFLYREKTVDNCSCKRGGVSGVAALDAKDDPTLRRGDIVVTRDGPMVFTGAERGKDRERAFVPAEEYKGLPQSTRRELAEMRVAKDPEETAVLPAGAVPASRSTIAATAISYTPRSARVAPVEVTPVAEAFSSFAN
jgi:hypothetical protein